MTYTIYKITCHINKKFYIGYTSKTPEQRLAQHVKDSRKEHFSHLHHAIQRYGPDQFSAEAIYQSLDKDHTHNVMEPYFIKEYDAINLGYNIQTGGEGGNGKPIKVYQYSKTLELIKVWDSLKEAAESIMVVSAMLSNVLRYADNGKGSGLKGYVWCREGVQPVLKKGSKFVEQLNENGERVALHHSVSAAARAVNASGTGITQGIKNPHQAWYGFYWRYLTCQSHS
jgi:hypothetical protein